MHDSIGLILSTKRILYMKKEFKIPRDNVSGAQDFLHIQPPPPRLSLPPPMFLSLNFFFFKTQNYSRNLGLKVETLLTSTTFL